MPELSTGTGEFFNALPRAISGGLAGTVVFTLMMKFLAPEMIGHPMDIAAVLGTFTGLGTPAGVVMHFLLGTLGFAIGFVIVGPYLPGPGWLRGVVFMAESGSWRAWSPCRSLVLDCFSEEPRKRRRRSSGMLLSALSWAWSHGCPTDPAINGRYDIRR